MLTNWTKSLSFQYTQLDWKFIKILITENIVIIKINYYIRYYNYFPYIFKPIFFILMRKLRISLHKYNQKLKTKTKHANN